MTTTAQKPKKKRDYLLDVFKDKATCAVCLEAPRWGWLLPCPNGHLIREACYDDVRGKVGERRIKQF